MTGGPTGDQTPSVTRRADPCEGAARDDPLVRELARRVTHQVRSGLAGHDGGEAALVPAVRAAAAGLGVVLGMDDVLAVAGRVHAQLWGVGPLEDLLREPGVSDVLVNGPHEVWVDRGSGLRRVDCHLGAEHDVRALAVRLAAAAGRRLDEAVPWVDARLPGGVRLHAVLPPVSPAGTLISLRMLGGRHRSLEALAAGGTFPPGWTRLLRRLLERRAAFLVSGGTGAGKTTLLSALLSAADPGERIVLVEDVAELWPEHPHVVRLEARHANVEGRGEVSLADLVRQALRMRPDRIVVGECRGAEVRDLLAALNTGHAGGCGTLHANAPADVPARLEALAAEAGMGPEAVRVQAAAALDAVVHVERFGGRRCVTEVALLHADARGGPLRPVPALTWDPWGAPEGAQARGPAWPDLARRLGLDPSGGLPAAVSSTPSAVNSSAAIRVVEGESGAAALAT